MLRDGQVAEQGTHDELVAKQGIYERMWNAQRKTDAADASFVGNVAE